MPARASATMKANNRARRWFFMSGLVLVTACTPDLFKLPWAPSDLNTGVAIYEHANYLGAAGHITQDLHLRDPDEGPCTKGGSGYPITIQVWNWDDCISSVRVAPGWRAILYEDGFEGNQFEVTEDISNLQLAPGKCDGHNNFNDCVTSIRVFPPK
jgi:hypothetical protein